MNERRINCGKSGNVSARTETGFLITPTGLAYESMRPEDILAVTLAGAATGPRLPSRLSVKPDRSRATNPDRSFAPNSRPRLGLHLSHYRNRLRTCCIVSMVADQPDPPV
jgi:ribulose-5-phosphate 4-epimerase/fuculose-1-phosphate aldolase